MSDQLSFGLIVTDPQAFRLQAMHRSRRCLSCSSDFPSTGPGNRVCGHCKSLEAWTSPDEFSVVASAAF